MLNIIIAGVGVVFLIAAIALGVKSTLSSMNKQKKDGDETVIEVGGKSYKVLTAVLASIGVICVIFSLSFTIIPTGYTGVRVTFTFSVSQV